MQYYFAPFEGITGYVYRGVHSRCFGGTDKYFLPFTVPNQTRTFTTKERKDLMPEHNQGYAAVPQIMSNHAEDFLWCAGEMKARGFTEVNLNLGCPSGTVVSKRRGSGLLAHRDLLKAFLDEIYEKSPLPISIKTRTGLAEPEEWESLLELLTSYPVKELIVHPRVREDYYKKPVRMEQFAQAAACPGLPLVYNGNLFTAEEEAALEAEYPQLQAIMLGRGVLANPGLFREIRTGQRMTKKELERFHWELYEEYQKELEGKNVLYKVKELWFYMIKMFAEAEKYEKRLRKVRTIPEYEAAVRELFAVLDLKESGGFHFP